MVDQATRQEGTSSGTADAGVVHMPAGDVLDPLVQAQCSLAVQLRRATG
jgi:hypothetical protein